MTSSKIRSLAGLVLLLSIHTSHFRCFQNVLLRLLTMAGRSMDELFARPLTAALSVSPHRIRSINATAPYVTAIAQQPALQIAAMTE